MSSQFVGHRPVQTRGSSISIQNSLEGQGLPEIVCSLRYDQVRWKQYTSGFTALFVSTYVVCERLSVMHEPAGVVEILVQILPEYPLF